MERTLRIAIGIVDAARSKFQYLGYIDSDSTSKYLGVHWCWYVFWHNTYN